MSVENRKFSPEEILEKLEVIAERYDEASAERAALEIAAKGLLFIHSARHGDAFAKYLEQFAADLTEEQRRVLASMGLR